MHVLGRSRHRACVWHAYQNRYQVVHAACHPATAADCPSPVLGCSVLAMRSNFNSSERSITSNVLQSKPHPATLSSSVVHDVYGDWISRLALNQPARTPQHRQLVSMHPCTHMPLAAFGAAPAKAHGKVGLCQHAASTPVANLSAANTQGCHLFKTKDMNLQGYQATKLLVRNS